MSALFGMLGPTLLLGVPVAHAQGRDPLPVHGWVQAEAGQDALRGWLGAAIPVHPEVAVAVGFVGTNTSAELHAGVTWELGALYVMPLVGVDYGYATGALGLAPQLYTVFEAPPLPVYVETWVRFGIHEPFDPTTVDVWESRYALLVTVRRWVAAGVQWEAGGPLGAPVSNLPVGARANFRLGEHVGVGVFAGWETQPAGRLVGLVPTFGLVGRGTVDVSW